MSNYRDDTIETAVASDTTWLNVGAWIVESAKASALAFMILGFVVEDQAQASEIEFGSRGMLLIESAQAEEQYFFSHEAIQRITDTAVFKDTVFSWIQDNIVESAQATDSDLSKVQSWVYESVAIQDTDLSHRTAYQILYDSAVLSDQAFAYVLDDTVESATINDSYYDHLSASSLVLASAQAEDSELSSYGSAEYVIESAVMNDGVTGVLQAFTLTQELAYLEDEVITDVLLGQAWICHSKTWAMSRYAPFGFDGLVIINGQVHLYNDQGVYVMQGSSENITAVLETGALDFGDQLTHPTSAYLEYQLSGLDKQLDIQVSTTQSGTKQSYQYFMPAEQADYLTNGRVLFGRGLRGRHFGFKISIQAQTAHINAMSIEHIQTLRRT